jgi:ribonucleoside-diphosphate reductase alpha chain
MIPVKTSDVLSAIRIRQKTPAGHMHVVIAVDPKSLRELEVFAQIGKAGGVPGSNLEAICRMVSSFLRIGGSLEQVCEQLDGIGSNMSIPTKGGQVMSLGDALSKSIRKYLDAKERYGLTAILTGAVEFEKE